MLSKGGNWSHCEIMPITVIHFPRWAKWECLGIINNVVAGSKNSPAMTETKEASQIKVKNSPQASGGLLGCADLHRTSQKWEAYCTWCWWQELFYTLTTWSALPHDVWSGCTDSLGMGTPCDSSFLSVCNAFCTPLYITVCHGHSRIFL